MNNIQKTAIRLIANAILYEKEKSKPCKCYRFDSSFITSRGIVSVDDLVKLQEEVNKLGWCFNILSFNDFVIQDKTFLSEMTKLGFGRVKYKEDYEIDELYNNKVQKDLFSRIHYCLVRDLDSSYEIAECSCNNENGYYLHIKKDTNEYSINFQFKNLNNQDKVIVDVNNQKSIDFDLSTLYFSTRDASKRIIEAIKGDEV